MNVRRIKNQTSVVIAMAVLCLLPAAATPILDEQQARQYILELSAAHYTTRELATRKILELGDAALPLLESLKYGDDPEQAFRVREIISKIELRIYKDKDAELISLIDRYKGSAVEGKTAVLVQLGEKRAWWQILKLFSQEKNENVQSRHQEWVGLIAVTAARECIEQGDARGARDFLEMAPSDRHGLLALADFHRSQGSLSLELARAKKTEGPKSKAWQLAMHAAAGNLVEANEAALSVGDEKNSALLSALLGDPIPWLKKSPFDQNRQLYPYYSELAARRWSERSLSEDDLEPLILATESKNSNERENSLGALFLLGQPRRAEAAYARDFPTLAFSYFESQQRIPEALSSIGLDPQNPDYTTWVAQKFTHLNQSENPQSKRDQDVIRDLVYLALFLESRGEVDLCDRIFLPPLAELAASDSDKFTDLLRSLCVGFGRESGAPLTALHSAVAWAGEDDARWERLLRETIGGQDEIYEIWTELARLDPTATHAARFEGLLALVNLHKDPDLIHERWMELFWKDLAKTPVEERDRPLTRMQFLLDLKPDAQASLLLWAHLPETHRKLAKSSHLHDLLARERWGDAADLFLEEIKQVTSSPHEIQPAIHAYAASSLRRAGREKEALIQDRLADQLALGHDADKIAVGYQYGGDYRRAAIWWQRAVIQSEPTSPEFENALEQHLAHLIENQDWQKAASVAEIKAQMGAVAGSEGSFPLKHLRLRLTADFCRALSLLKKDRAGSINLLNACYQLCPTDGSLADEFFPALLQAGLKTELEKWFEPTWKTLRAVTERYPNSDNLLNVAAWLASRAQTHLPESEQFLKKALALNPQQSTYLDTMAETHFAMGNRAKALGWSCQSLNFMPKDPQILRQYERFKSAPLPPAPGR
jgi:hypothetical protein